MLGQNKPLCGDFGAHAEVPQVATEKKKRACCHIASLVTFLMILIGGSIRFHVNSAVLPSHQLNGVLGLYREAGC